MFIVRKSNHIAEDIQRNWSSWNYGLEGFEGTREDLDAAIADITDESPLYISGFEIYPSDLKTSKFGQLYANYWVLIDTHHGSGISCNILDAETIDQALSLVTKGSFEVEMGEGDMVDATGALVVYSNNDLHVLQID